MMIRNIAKNFLKTKVKTPAPFFAFSNFKKDNPPFIINEDKTS
jgi:hypothetical protein